MERSVPVMNRYSFVPQFVHRTAYVDRKALKLAAYPDLIIKTLFEQTFKVFRYDTVYSEIEIDYNQHRYIFEKQNY